MSNCFPSILLDHERAAVYVHEPPWRPEGGSSTELLLQAFSRRNDVASSLGTDFVPSWVPRSSDHQGDLRNPWSNLMLVVTQSQNGRRRGWRVVECWSRRILCEPVLVRVRYDSARVRYGTLPPAASHPPAYTSVRSVLVLYTRDAAPAQLVGGRRGSATGCCCLEWGDERAARRLLLDACEVAPCTG